MITFAHTSDAHPQALTSSLASHPQLTAQSLTSLALTAGSAGAARIAAGTAVDAGGLLPDLHDVNSWTQRVDEVDPVELLEVQLCNSTAPFILISRLRPAMAASHGPAHLRRQRLRHGGPVQPWLQGTRPPAHQHGQGRAEHADPHQRRGDAHRRHPHDRRGHRLDHRRAAAPDEDAAGARRASTRRWTSSTVRPGSTTRSSAASGARTCTAASSRTTGRPPGRARRGRRRREVAPIGGPAPAFVVFDLPHPSRDAGAAAPRRTEQWSPMSPNRTPVDRRSVLALGGSLAAVGLFGAACGGNTGRELERGELLRGRRQGPR